MRKSIVLIIFAIGFSVSLYAQPPKRVIPVDLQGNVIGAAGGTSAGAAGGGGALTGLASYSNIAGHFSVETIDGTKSVYVTGAPFTIKEEHVLAGSGKVWNSSTGVVSDLDITEVQPISGDTITFSGQLANFTINDSVSLFLIAPPMGYDLSQDVWEFLLRNPNYAHYTDIDPIIDETNLNIDSAYAVIYMESYQYFSLHVNVSGGVIVTMYVSNNSAAADDDETSDWVDYSSTIFGAANVEDAEGFYIQDTTIMPLKFLVKVVTSDATNAADIFLRKYY